MQWSGILRIWVLFQRKTSSNIRYAAYVLSAIILNTTSTLIAASAACTCFRWSWFGAMICSCIPHRRIQFWRRRFAASSRATGCGSNQNYTSRGICRWWRWYYWRWCIVSIIRYIAVVHWELIFLIDRIDCRDQIRIRLTHIQSFVEIHTEIANFQNVTIFAWIQCQTLSPNRCIAFGQAYDVAGNKQIARFIPNRYIDASGWVADFECSHSSVLFGHGCRTNLQHDENNVDVFKIRSNVFDCNALRVTVEWKEIVFGLMCVFEHEKSFTYPINAILISQICERTYNTVASDSYTSDFKSWGMWH